MKRLLLTLSLTSLLSTAHAANRLCVFDMIGNVGEMARASRDFALAMQKATGAELQVKVFTDERVAVEDFRTGQCQAVLANWRRDRRGCGVRPVQRPQHPLARGPGRQAHDRL